MEDAAAHQAEEPDTKRRRVDGADGAPSSSATAADAATGAQAHAVAQQQHNPQLAYGYGDLQQQQQQQQQPHAPPPLQLLQQPQQPLPAPPRPHLQLSVVSPPPAAPAPSASYARSSGAYTQREEHLQRMEDAGDITFAYVKNDGTPLNMIRLIGLKNVFSRQLPNMPKEYIARLVLNRHHRSVALVNKAGAVIGGITYRVFPPLCFGEIAFCAVTAAEQVKGFGTRLMNKTKQAARDHDGLSHFLTYADNNAVGYFLKQGFTRQITLPRDVWGGYIKDYDGGTLMECIIHGKLPYGDLAGMLRAQKEHLDRQMRGLSNAHVVHAPPRRLTRPLPKEEAHPQQREVPVAVDVGAIPGVREAGWAPEHAQQPKYRLLMDGGIEPVDVAPGPLATLMEGALAALEAHTDAWPFRRPVDASEAVDYYDIIKDPVDLSLVRCRLAARSYYLTLEMFLADLRRMFANCRYYNTAATPYYQCANRLEAALDAYMAAHLVYEDQQLLTQPQY